MSKSPPLDQTNAILDQISYLSLKFEDVQKALSFLGSNAHQLSDSDYVIDVYRRVCYGVIRCVEVDKKGAKRFIPDFSTAIKNLKSPEKVVESLKELLLSLPMMIQARWDLLAFFASSKLTTTIDDILFVEVMSCAPDQDLSARCSSIVLQMAVNPKYSDRAAQMIYNALTSPVYAVRNNVHRAWMSRIITVKSSQKCIERLLDLCRCEVIDNQSPMWPVSYREIVGLTCVDLEWRAVLDEEPYDRLTFALVGYFLVLNALKNASSHVHVQLKLNDPVIRKGIQFYGHIVTKQAILVCSKYKVYPKDLEKAVVCEMVANKNPEIYDIVDDDMLRSFRKETQMMYTKNKIRKKSEQQQKRQAELKNTETKKGEAIDRLDKFYPANDQGTLKVEVNLHSEFAAIKTVDRFLKVQHPTEEYPSVAAVMENLEAQNIDERLYCQKIAIISDIIQSKLTERKYSRKIYTELLFTMITKMPLRSIVDYIGALIKAESAKEYLIREKFFLMACNLMKLEDENARPLSLYHLFVSTCFMETVKVTEVWNILKDLKPGIKKKKMAEMLAKVVTSSEIKVEDVVLSDMILCSVGVHRDRFQGESPQLFVAAVSKLLAFRNESERIMIFQAIAESPQVLLVIKDLINHTILMFSDSAYQMVLFFFTRFHIGSPQFYTKSELSVIAQIVNFCHWCIRKFASEPMMLSIAIDAICGYMPWTYIREKALLKEKAAEGLVDPVEKLICQNLRHNRFCVLLAEHDKEDKPMKIEDFEELPKAQFIVEIVKNKNKGQEELAKLLKKLGEIVKTAESFEETHAVWLAYGLLSDRALEMIDDADLHKDIDPDYKQRYPSRALMEGLVNVGADFQTSASDVRMANSWLDKSLGKIQALTTLDFCLDHCPH